MVSYRRLLPLALIALATGCAPQPPRKPAAPPPVGSTAKIAPADDSALDPCAEQLHELSGLFLEFFAAYHALPPTLDDLLVLAPKENKPSLLCPVSHEKYIYTPDGPYLPGAGRLIVYDAKPVHDGMRWGIAIKEPVPNQPLEATVIRVPEAALK